MKKRYLSMLMAVVLCLTLGAGALAADGEVETAAPVDVVEAVEAAAKEAAPVEEAEPEAEAEPVEEPAPLSASVPVPLDGAGQPDSGVAIEGYGGTVVYNVILPTPGNFSWNSPTPTGVQVDRILRDGGTRGLTIDCDAQTVAGTYSFKQVYYEGTKNLNGQFSVLTLEEAMEQDKVSSDTYKVYTECTVPGASPSPLPGVTVGLYTSNPDATATPVATFTSDAHGEVELSAARIPGSALPKGVGETQTYYIKEIAVPDGYALSGDVENFTYKAEWEKDSSNHDATTMLKFAKTMVWNSGTLTSNRLSYAYDGFDLVAWTKGNVTWSETEGYDWDEVTLPGVKFGVYSDADCTTLVKEFTTDENGKATITAADFAAEYRPAVDEPKTFYLKQSGAQSTEHGERPMADRCWTLTASAAQVGTAVTITLSLPDELLPEELAEDGTLRVYNERYTSLCFDIEKTVESKDVQPGTNTFTFLVAVAPGEGEPTVSFTPKGGEPIEPESVPNPAGSPSERSFSPTCYTVPLTVSGTGTASGTFTLSGWESELMGIAVTVYEQGEAPADWDYADYMYLVTCPDDGQADWTYLLYDNMEMVVSRFERVQEPGGDDDGIEAYPGYDGNWYAAEGEVAESVCFVNTYTKLTPEPTATPAPTAKPAHSPKTGDEANVMLWLALAAVSVFGIALVGRKKVK